MSDLFGKLNEQQIAAVRETEGYVRVVAGAGSGKTGTLTRRYAYLVKAAGIHPGSVLCVTFTNKAAGEMKRRVRALIGDGYDTSLITTYHGFCVRVLREDIHRLFYPKSFLILDESDQRKILSEIYGELDIKLDRASFETVLDSVHRLKTDERYVDAMVRGDFSGIKVPPKSPVQPASPLEETIVRRYLEKQRKIFGLDFDDLVAFTFAVFASHPEVREKWAERLYYIQVDEFQDSSKRELRLLRMLCASHENLFVVGDPDQNIYEWRGADMKILVDFDKLFPGAKTVLLTRNYRSSGNILRAANTLIAHNINRVPKELFTTDEPGADVIHLHAKTEAEEGKWIAEEIKRLAAEESTPYKEIAVLYRAGFLSRFVEAALLDAKIPYELYGSVRFYERMEIRDALAYLRLLLWDDDEALERIVNVPRRSFGKTKSEALRAIAAEEGTSLFEALRRHVSDPIFARSSVADLVGTILELRAKTDSLPVSELLGEILTRSGYETYIREYGSTERLDNLAELKRSVWDKEHNQGEFYPLSDYLQEVALESDRESGEDADRVKLMTIHASKGLEFDACFVCGMTEGIFPSSRTLEERKDAGLEEERRLCFVAVTRAKKRLYLTESEGTGSDRAVKRPSRFLADIGERNYTRIGTVPKELSEASAPSGGTGSPSESERAPGSVVNHPVFGRGVVADVDRAKGVYYILFEKTGARRPVSMDYDFDVWGDTVRRLAAGEKTEESTPPPPDASATDDKPEASASDDKPGNSAPRDVRQSSNIRAETAIASQNIDLHSPYVNHSSTAETAGETDEQRRDTDAHALTPPEHTASASNAGSSFPLQHEQAAENALPVQLSLSPLTSPQLPSDPAHAEKAPREKKRTAKKRDVPRKKSVRSESPPDNPQLSMQLERTDSTSASDADGNLWKRPDVPKTGWVCENIVDLGEAVGVCRMCSHQIIRYVHVMRHPVYHRSVGAGCVCAGRMEGDPEGAKARESAFKNRLARRETFMKTPLKRSRGGNEYLRYKGEVVTVLEDRYRPGHFKSVLRGQFSPPRASKEEALGDAFDLLDPWKMEP